jgi:hypothetical protein
MRVKTERATLWVTWNEPIFRAHHTAIDSDVEE